MSGHNKWSKIKHKKAASDAQKSKVFSKHAAFIAVESRLAGGNLAAAGLSAAIERAKKDSMPKENIDRAIAKGAGSDGAKLESITYEAFGPGGVAMLICVITDNNNRTAPLVRHVFTKVGLSVGTPGSAMWAFMKNTNGYVPQNTMEISDIDGEKLASLIEALEELEDVQDIYTTVDTPK